VRDIKKKNGDMIKGGKKKKKRVKTVNYLERIQLTLENNTLGPNMVTPLDSDHS
jgi:hypothetical protein